MIRLAHLSDIHLLDENHGSRPFSERLRLSTLSFGRRLDHRERKGRLLDALEAALDARADHIVITGDLTEDGHPAQFAALAEVLSSVGVHPSRITLVPGNHDSYHREGEYERALSGPLSPWAGTSTPGSVVSLPGVDLLPISTAHYQRWWSATGSITDEQKQALAALVRCDTDGRAIVVVQHHPPLSHKLKVLNRVDGLVGYREVQALVQEHARVHVLHGHTHFWSSLRAHPRDVSPRIFCAPAVVDSLRPVRMYQVDGGRVTPLDGDVPLPLLATAIIPG